MSSLADEFFVTGGTLRRDAACYVVRQADQELLTGLRQGKFCYVLTSRQMGKSSLMVRTAAQLREEGCGVIILDLTAIGQNLNAEQWYRGLLEQMGVQLELEEELIEFWRSSKELGAMQRWMRAICEVVLPHYPGQVVVFIDEIDAVLSLPFSTDELFAAIRECYNRRTENEDLERLTFCLLGVASPSDLIRDTRTTPFNIGQRIELRDFTEAETAQFAFGLPAEENSTRLLKRIHYWTNGHPYLTQRLCQALATPQSEIRNPKSVDRLCEDLFFSPRAQERDDNLLFVRERMLNSEVDLPALLHRYEQVLRGKRVFDDEADPLVSALQLSGIAKVEAGRLRSRNRIYSKVFNREWINANMPDAEQRRQRAAFRRGLVRATAVAAVIVAAMAWLVFIALQQGNLAKEETRRAEAALADARQQRANAEAQQVEAGLQRQHALEQKTLAEQKQAEAEEQRNRAVKQEEDNRWLLYASRMNLAQQALAENNFGRVRELLMNYAPTTDYAAMRGFEWYHLWRLCCGTTFAQPATTRGALSVAYSPDGKRLVTSGRRQAVKILDAETGRELRLPNGDFGQAHTAVYSPDGLWLAAADQNGVIKLLNTLTGGQKLLRQNQSGMILSLAFSPDGQTLASGNFDGTVRVWSVAFGQELAVFRDHKQQVKSVAFSPDGKTLASGSYDETVKVWDLSHRQLLFSLPYPRLVNCVAFSPDGKLLAVGGWGGSVSLWELATRKEAQSWDAHAEHITSLSFSPAGNRLARNLIASAGGRTVKLWNAESGLLVGELTKFTENASSVAFSPNGANLAVASIDGSISLWDIATQQQLKISKDILRDAWTVAISPDSKLLATGYKRNSVKLWDATTSDQIAEFVGGDGSLAFSPDGTKLVVASSNHTVRIWSMVTQSEVSKLTDLGRVHALAFSPDGKTLAIGSSDHTVRLFDTLKWRQFDVLQKHTDIVWSVAFSPDGKTLASASSDNTVKLWNPVTGQLINTLSEHTGTVNYVTFSPDGKLLASASADRNAKLWEVATGELLKTFQGHANAVMAARFSPDGKRLATAGRDNLIKIWDIARGLELLSLSGHQKEVWSLAFSADGRLLASGSYDGTVRLWRATTDTEISDQFTPTGKLAHSK